MEEILRRRTLIKVRYYMLWDCSSCDTKGINANTCKQCPHCGNPKELDDRKEEEYRSSTPVGKTYKHRGADISCQSCGSENEKRFSCRNCGRPLDPKFAKQVKRFTHRSDDEWRQTVVQVDQSGYTAEATNTPWLAGASAEPVTLEEPQSSPEPPKVARAAGRPAARTTSTIPVSVSRGYSRWLLGGLLLAVIVVAMVFVYQRTHAFYETVATPIAASWTYSLPLEDYAARDKVYETESDFWRPPSGAFNVSHRTTITRYETIYDDVWVNQTCTRTEDNSYTDTDGTWVHQVDSVDYDCSGYERQAVGQEPVYGTLWQWQQMEWANTTPLTASGNSQAVTYPVFTATPTLRQAGEPVTTFTITYIYRDRDNENERASRSYPRSIWEEIELDRPRKAIIDGFDRLRAVDGVGTDYDELRERLR